MKIFKGNCNDIMKKNNHIWNNSDNNMRQKHIKNQSVFSLRSF